MDKLSKRDRSNRFWNQFLLSKLWFIPVVSVLLFDAHLQFLFLIKEQVLNGSVSDYLFIILSITLTSIPFIFSLGKLVNHSLNGIHWPLLVMGGIVYPSCLIGINSLELLPPFILNFTQHFTEQTWFLLLVASALVYWKSQPRQSGRTPFRSRFISLAFSLDGVCVLLAIIWALVLAAVFAPYENPLMHQPIPMLIDSYKLSNHPLNFVSYFLQLMVIASLILSLFFLNRYLLIRKVLVAHGVIYFGLTVLLVTVVLTPLYVGIALCLPLNELPPGIANLTPAGDKNIFSPINYQFTFMVLAISSPIILAFERKAQETQLALIKQEQTQTELKLLQQQVNPHFLFNTLNSLYALTLKKSNDAPELVMQLSNLLRYTVYEGQNKQVSLTQEVEYLKNYWSLQSIRMGDKARLEVTWAENTNGLQLPPLLLINILENAFKHGVEPSMGDGYLKFEMQVNANQLKVSCRNSIPEKRATSLGGMGLTNLRRRLDLLYGDTARLDVSSSAHEWNVELRMRLEVTPLKEG
ncbi:sensor histidine kinase [Alteromonas facilis]|uniref:sensor histidine kinase n=1 Tax=Alteromonas facilis TaxID=2048004 RepID=UPI000C283BEF|nr:sensor histidine kinase [Alteromonas facilis]